MNALVSWTKTLLPLVREQLHGRMQVLGGKHWCIGFWLALAVDGARATTPGTKANEEAFCTPHYGQNAMAKFRRKKSRQKKQRYRMKAEKQQPVKPQIWLSLLWAHGDADALELEEGTLSLQRAEAPSGDVGRGGIP